MKFSNILKGVAAMVVASGLGSCSSDYLTVAPETNFSQADIISNLDGVRSGYYGVCRSMYMQYSDMDGYNFFNGEAWVQMFYGDVFGSDYVSNFWMQTSGVMNYGWNQVNLEGGWQPRLMWMYAYNLINQCNKVLGGIDEADGNRTELNRIKASLLTIRAHAYVRLLQVYGPRWIDSNNGEVYTIVMRLPGDPDDVPVVKMNVVLKQIYDDLDEAIRLYTECGDAGKRTFIWEPNINVAQGIYARAALLKDDYVTAEKMAHDARQGFKIMTADEYKAGFVTANDEYMWSNALTDEFMYYWATGSLYACNGAYATVWEFGAGAINIDLYNLLDEKDIRRDLFFTPDKLDSGEYRGVDGSCFYSIDYVNVANMNMNDKQNRNMSVAIRRFGDSLIPGGDVAKYGNPYTKRVGDDTESLVQVVFGAQYKFWGNDVFGTNQFPFMRASEMLLTEAEAAYHNGNSNVAVSCLNELNKLRIEGYNCTKSGEALLDEIRLTRRIELWGEGHSWFDLKRWNMPLVRRAWKDGDETSGNYPPAYALEKKPSDNRGWRFAFPSSEFNYNKAVDISLINR